jgi:hypothetical protein
MVQGGGPGLPDSPWHVPHSAAKGPVPGSAPAHASFPPLAPLPPAPVSSLPPQLAYTLAKPMMPTATANTPFRMVVSRAILVTDVTGLFSDMNFISDCGEDRTATGCGNATARQFLAPR